MVKNNQHVFSTPANAGDARDVGSVPVSGRFSGGGNGTLLQHSCLQSSLDRGAWQATVYGVTVRHDGTHAYIFRAPHLSDISKVFYIHNLLEFSRITHEGSEEKKGLRRLKSHLIIVAVKI